MTQPPIYPDLAVQIQCFLLRRGPSHVMRVIQGVRHNGNAKAVHAAIDADPRTFVRFQYEHHNGKMQCSRGCVRLVQQDESSYVPEEDRNATSRERPTLTLPTTPRTEPLPVAGTSEDVPDFL